MKHGCRVLVTLLCALGWFGPVVSARADDKADLDSTKIIGNRELPKVLYIVPWRGSTPGDLLERPMPSVMDDDVQAVDRDTFRRIVRYQQQTPPSRLQAAPESEGKPDGSHQ